MLQTLIALAKDLRAARHRGEETGLTPEEIAFYDALADNQSAVDILGNVPGERGLAGAGIAEQAEELRRASLQPIGHGGERLFQSLPQGGDVAGGLRLSLARVEARRNLVQVVADPGNLPQ